jgi:DnaK suppressor protein
VTKRSNAKKCGGRAATRKTARRTATGSSKAKKTAGKKAAGKKRASGSARTGRRAAEESPRAGASAEKTRRTNKSVKTGGAKKTAKKKVAVRKVAVKGARGTSGSNKRTSTVAAAPAAPPEPRIPKTRLSDAELAEFKALLLRKRAELTGDVQDLARHALDHKVHGGIEHSAMPIHMADLGSDNWEKEFTLGLIANEQGVVREIDQALERINDRTYGVCLATHKRITKARLRAKPWAKYCIQYALAREEGRAV